MNTSEAKKKQGGARPGTENIEKIFAVLQALGAGWHTRAAIAKRLGKRKINPSDLGALDRLIAAKRIEARQAASVNTSMMLRWEYRVPEGGDRPA